MIIDLEHIFLLGWHSSNGINNLTKWSGNKPLIDIVIIGATDFDMEHIMWAAPLHKNFDILLIPYEMNPQQYAKDNGGLRAYGWYIKDGINRGPIKPLVDRWAWFDKLNGEINGKS